MKKSNFFAVVLLISLAGFNAMAVAKKKSDYALCNEGGNGIVSYQEANDACLREINKRSKKAKDNYIVSNLWARLGLHAFLQDDYAQGVEYYTKAIALSDSPMGYGHYASRGQLYLKLGKDDKAAADFERVVNEAPYSPDYRRAAGLLGIVYHKKGQYRQAVKYLVEGYRYFRPSPQLVFNEEERVIYQFYGLDKWENYEGYLKGTYVPPQLAPAKPVVSAQRQEDVSGSSQISYTPPNDGLYRSSDPNFSMGDPSLDF